MFNRPNGFHVDTRLPLEARSLLEDYKGSGYDRGHMSPNHDMSSHDSQVESFALSNMVPQSHGVNTKIWANIERGVRTAAMSGNDIYVVTGPVFDNTADEVDQINDDVMVPTQVFKAFYNKTTGVAAAYIASNDINAVGNNNDYDVIDLDTLESKTGFNIFPSLSVDIKKKKVNKKTLPQPESKEPSSAECPAK